MKHIFLYIVLPWSVFIVLILIFVNSGIQIFPNNRVLAFIGMVIWMIALIVPITDLELVNSRRRTVISVGLSILGTILIAISTPFTSISTASVSTTTEVLNHPDIVDEIFVAFLLLLVIALPHIIGASLATTAVEKRMLSKVEKIILKQPLSLPYSATTILDNRMLLDDPNQRHWLRRKEIPIQLPSEAFCYTWLPETFPMLIASFNRTTAFYFLTNDPSQKNKMIIISNDLIYSLELQSKNDPQNQQ